MSRFPAVGGGGGDSYTPVASKDRAETFEESDVSIDNLGTDIDVGGGSIGFGSETSITNDGFVSEWGSFENHTESGIVVNPNEQLEGLYLVPETKPQNPAVELRDSSGNVIATDTSSRSGFLLRQQLEPGNEYRVVMLTGGSDTHYFSDVSLPLEYETFDITSGWVDGSTDLNTIYTFTNEVKSVVALKDVKSAIEWSQPDDIFRWDAATFTKTEDGESVDVYIEESTDGGSTWTTISGPISRGEIITAAPDTRCRFRVEFSRSDIKNSPSLDSIYRRWVV